MVVNGSLCQPPVNTEEPTGSAYEERDGQQVRETHCCSFARLFETQPDNLESIKTSAGQRSGRAARWETVRGCF